jgi:hypothetical protein
MEEWEWVDEGTRSEVGDMYLYARPKSVRWRKLTPKNLARGGISEFLALSLRVAPRPSRKDLATRNYAKSEFLAPLSVEHTKCLRESLWQISSLQKLDKGHEFWPRIYGSKFLAPILRLAPLSTEPFKGLNTVLERVEIMRIFDPGNLFHGENSSLGGGVFGPGSKFSALETNFRPETWKPMSEF